MQVDSKEQGGKPSAELADVLRNPKKLRTFFARAIPLSEFIGDVRTASSVVPCPFHDDSSPSAKMFHDEDGTERLFCFTEHRQFTSYDFVVKVLNEDPLLYLMKRFSESEMKGILSKVTFTISNRPVVVDFDDAIEALPDFEEFLSRIYFIYKHK